MKKITCLVLSFCIILGGLAPCYAADFMPITGSALAIGPQFKAVSDINGSVSITASGSSTDPYYVKPVSASASRYYVNSVGNAVSSSVTVDSFAHLVTDITYSIAQSVGYIGNRITYLMSAYLDPIMSDVDDIRRYLNVDYYQLLNDILSAVQSNGSLGSPFVPYFMPDPNNFDYTGAGFREFTVYSANNDGVTSTSRNRDNFIRILRDYLGADNALFYQSFRRLFNYVITSDYANENYQKVFNMNTGTEYSLPVRSIWVDIRYINRFLTALIYRVTGEPLTDGVITTYNNQTITADKALTLKQYLYLLGENISTAVGRLAFVLANDQDITLRNNTADQVSALTTNFTSSGSPSKVSAGDIGTMASGAAELKSGFSSSANASDAFRGFSTSGQDERWNWFSQDILNSLDTTSSNNRSLKSNNDFTNFSSEYYNEVMRYAD